MIQTPSYKGDECYIYDTIAKGLEEIDVVPERLLLTRCHADVDEHGAATMIEEVKDYTTLQKIGKSALLCVYM